MSKQPAPQTRFVDRPEVCETFADSIRAISFDGQTLRMEFCVSRMDEPKSPKPPTSRQYPTCRLVLTPKAGLDLFNQLQRFISTLERTGVIKRKTPSPQTVQ